MGCDYYAIQEMKIPRCLLCGDILAFQIPREDFCPTCLKGVDKAIDEVFSDSRDKEGRLNG